MKQVYATYLQGGLTQAAQEFWAMETADQLDLLNDIPDNEFRKFIRLMLIKHERPDEHS